MLKVFRHKGVAKKVLWVVAGIIIISFGFGFGISSYGASFSLSQTAGKIYGKAISLKEYHREYQNAHDQAVMMHGADVEKVLAMMDMDTETWTRILLLKSAQQRGIKAADMEVIQFIQTIPFFQRDGEFDKRLYANMVKNVFKREPRDFEEGLRDQIKIMKLFTPAIKAINFTDEAVRKEYENRNQKVQVSYVAISAEAFSKEVVAEDKEITAYFAAHREDFLEPEAISATVITIPLDAKASAKDKADIAGKADALFKKLNAGADLATAAKEYNATVKDTGFFNMNAPSEAVSSSLDLLQQIFTAKTGDILNPVATAEGYLIARITEKKPAFIPAFDAIKDKVKTAVIEEKATARAAEKAGQFRQTLAEQVKGGTEFIAAARALGLEPKQPPFFGLGEYVPEIGMSDDFTSAAFKLNKDNPLSEVVLTARGPAILYWNASQPIDAKKFEEVKQDFEKTLHDEARVRVMNELIRSLREKANVENYIAKINAAQKKAMEKMRVK